MRHDNDIRDMQTDKRLRSEIKASLPAPADGEWFTRRLMNRLPERKQPMLPKVLQAACYALSVLLLIACWVYCMVDTAHNGLTSMSLMTAALIPAVALVCLSVFGVQAMRRAV